MKTRLKKEAEPGKPGLSSTPEQLVSNGGYYITLCSPKDDWMSQCVNLCKFWSKVQKGSSESVLIDHGSDGFFSSPSRDDVRDCHVRSFRQLPNLPAPVPLLSCEKSTSTLKVIVYWSPFKQRIIVTDFGTYRNASVWQWKLFPLQDIYFLSVLRPLVPNDKHLP